MESEDVNQAIHTLTEIEDDNYELILQGGTSLAKAHRVIRITVRVKRESSFG